MCANLLESSQSYELFFNSGFPTDFFSKLSSCVIVTGSEIFDTLIFIKSYESQNAYIYIFIVSTQNIFKRNGLLMQIHSKLIDFIFFD